MPGDGREEVLVTNARQRAHLEAAREHLSAFLQIGGRKRCIELDCVADDYEMIEDVVVGAEELRYAGNAVGKVTGGIDVEDVLDVVFREFCIGK